MTTHYIIMYVDFILFTGLLQMYVFIEHPLTSFITDSLLEYFEFAMDV